MSSNIRKGKAGGIDCSCDECFLSPEAGVSPGWVLSWAVGQEKGVVIRDIGPRGNDYFSKALPILDAPDLRPRIVGCPESKESVIAEGPSRSGQASCPPLIRR